MIKNEFGFIDRVTVDFILRNGKQHTLIYFLNKYTALTNTQLAEALDITVDDLISVLEKRSFLAPDAAEKLILCFCLWIGS